MPLTRLLLLGFVVLVLGAPASAQAAAPPGFVGMVSEDTLAGNAHYRAKQFEAMRTRGVTLVRQTFDWSLIERRRGKYDFSFFDGFVGGAAKAGITVMPILFNPPKFHSKRTKHSKLRGTYPPKRASAMAEYAAAVARRYGPNGSYWQAHPSVPAVPVRTWQVWNEPNLPVYWRPKPSAKAYVALLKAVSLGLRAVDPGAEVVSAGLPQSRIRGAIKLNTYLKAMLRAGAGQWMNTVAVNPYSKRPSGVVAILRRVRQVLNANGAAATQIRATELGWSDVGPSSAFKAGRKGQATRVRVLIRALGAQQQALGLRGFVYFNWRDAKPYAGFRDFWGLHTGLLNRRGRAKAALASFAAATAAL